MRCAVIVSQPTHTYSRPIRRRQHVNAAILAVAPLAIWHVAVSRSPTSLSVA